jgi:hypothetical protein
MAFPTQKLPISLMNTKTNFIMFSGQSGKYVFQEDADELGRERESASVSFDHLLDEGFAPRFIVHRHDEDL